MSGFAKHLCGLEGIGFLCPACAVVREQREREANITPEMKRDVALTHLREWFPNGGKIFVIRRRRSKRGNLVVDCKRVVGHDAVPMGITVANALERHYNFERDGFYCRASELPELFTSTLSRSLFGEPGKLTVEML